jgi:hypothetical protein
MHHQRRPVLGDVEARSSVGKVERARAFRDRIVAAAFEQARRARVVDRRAGLRIFAVTGPEDAEPLFDFLVGDARIIGQTAFAGPAQLLEDRARTVEGEAVWTLERSGDVLDDAPVLPRLAGTVDCLVDLDDAPFDLRHEPFILFVQAARQDDVGVAGRVAEEEIDRGENSSLSSARVMNVLSGSETFGLKQMAISPLISPASILRNIS